MGANNYTELLNVPLCAQSKPIRATDKSHVTETTVNLKITPPNFSNKIQIIDTSTKDNEVVFEVQTKTFSSKCTLQTPDGVALVTIKSKSMFSNSYSAYNGRETQSGTPGTFGITVDSRLMSPLVIYAEFTDKATGDPCRVLVQGNASDRIVVVYLERGQDGSAPLSVDPPTYQAIARICRPKVGVFSSEEYIVEIASGVDATLVLMLWMVRHEMLTVKRNNREAFWTACGTLVLLL